MEQLLRKHSMVPDGVQGIFLIEKSENILDQKILLVQDHDDRGTGTGILQSGLPGGAIEPGETPLKAIVRETREEVALTIEASSFKKFGIYSKLRPNGCTNQNHLFIARLDCNPKNVTNDPNEVSLVLVKTLREIINLTECGYTHLGSIRLIFHFFNKNKSQSLNMPASLNGYTF